MKSEQKRDKIPHWNTKQPKAPTSLALQEKNKNLRLRRVWDTIEGNNKCGGGIFEFDPGRLVYN